MRDEPAKGARTRQAILGTAIRRFASAGFRATSVAEIASEVEISPSAVYAYFPSKQVLFETAVDADAAGLIQDAMSEVSEGSFDGDWPGLFSRLLSNLPRYPLARRVLSGAEGTTTDRLADLPAIAQVRKGMAAALQRGQLHGTVRRDVDPELMATGFEVIVLAALITILQTGGEADPARADGLFAVLEASLRPEN